MTREDAFKEINETQDFYVELLKDRILKESALKVKPLLLIEDGSVDFDELERKGINGNYTVIIYRQGANKPEVLKYE